MIDLKSLPPVEFAAKDTSQIETDIIVTYEAISGRTLAPGDPVRLFLQSVAQIISHQRVLIDYSAKQNLLAYAEGSSLDHIGALLETERLSAQAATTTARFILSAPQPQVESIPAGTRVAPGGQLFFVTTQTVNIPAGTTQIDVIVKCSTVGTVGNGWAPGQINKLVDPLPWIQKVENITASSGGSDTESDDKYLERIQQAPEKFSTAGPDGAYQYWARAAHQDITDVSVTSPSPGVVEIRPLLKDGQIPGAEILQAVVAKCNDKSIRPLTDQVNVLAPTEAPYNIDLTYWISTVNSTITSAIQEAVNTSIDEYKAWQRARLGRDINPSELIARVMKAGARRVSVTSPTYTPITLSQVAHSGTVTVTYGGLEND